MTAVSETYFVPECNLPELEARIGKLNKRAKRLGVQEITLVKEPDHKRYQVEQLQSGCEIGGPMTRKVWHKLHPSCRTIEEEKARCQTIAATGAFLAAAWEPTGQVMTWWKVVVTGQTPTYAGWTFVATLEPMELDSGEVLNLVQCVPGQECPAAYRHKVGHCDHCQAKRRRNQTFVLRHEDGKHKCVGRQCIKDFLGYNGDPHQLAGMAELLAQLEALCDQAEEEEGFGGGGWRGEKSWDGAYFLALTAARIERRGWLSRTVVRETGRGPATADVVLDILNPPAGPYVSDKEKKEHAALVADTIVTDEHKAQAEAALDWCQAISEVELEGSNYLANINLVARCGTVSRKTAGLAASIIPAYKRALEQEVKRQEFAKRPPSVHVGTVGKRQEFTVKLERLMASEGAYGTTGIHKLVDAQGNDMTWFASGSGNWLKEGKTYKVKATVKAHSDYKGRPQTVVSRLTVIEELVPA